MSSSPLMPELTRCSDTCRHLSLLMRSEPEEILVRRMVQRPRGGSGNNPYLKPNRTAMEYTVLMNPQAIAKKIMQVNSDVR